MTTKELIKSLKKLIKSNPEVANFPVLVYEDWYEQVEGDAITLCQVNDVDSYPLEIVGHYSEDDNIALEDCNAVCIN